MGDSLINYSCMLFIMCTHIHTRTHTHSACSVHVPIMICSFLLNSSREFDSSAAAKGKLKNLAGRKSQPVGQAA